MRNGRMVMALMCGLFLFGIPCLQAGTVEPCPVGPGEAAQLQFEQRQAMAQTGWGQTLINLQRFQGRIQKPQALSDAERAELLRRVDPTLAEILGMGERKAWKCIVLFIPDRLLDCLDMVSLGVGLGLGLGADVHVTRWASLGLGAEVGAGVYWYYNRNLMIAPVYGALADFGPWQAYAMGFAGAGTGWNRGAPGAGAISFNKAGKFSPQDKMCQQGWSDPWGVGIGWAAEIHPVEIADFFAGLFTLGFVDISRDDFANPNRVRYKIGMPVEAETKE